MTAQEIDRIQNAIRHIQTAVDVDPWAVELAVNAMEKQIPKEPLDPELGISPRHPIIIPCGNCAMELSDHIWDFCPYCGQKILWNRRAKSGSI